MSKQLTKTIMVPSTSSQASLNVAPGAVVSAPVNGDIWNEAGALKIKTPTVVKTLATVDQIPGAAARTKTIDLVNYGASITYTFEVADMAALAAITTMVNGDWAHVLGDGVKYYFDGKNNTWRNMGSKDWTALPYVVGSDSELVLVVTSSNADIGTDIVVLGMNSQGTYSPGDTVTICSSIGLTIVTTDGEYDYDSNTIDRLVMYPNSMYINSSFSHHDCFTIRAESQAVLRLVVSDWAIEEPSALRVRSEGTKEDGFGNVAELASDGYRKRFTLSEAEYAYHKGIKVVNIKDTGFGVDLTGTVADVTELNTYTPTAYQLFYVTSTGTVWACKNTAWYDTGLSAANFTNPPCYTDGYSKIRLKPSPEDIEAGIHDYRHLPVVILRADLTKAHEEITIEMDRDSVDIKSAGILKFLDIDTTGNTTNKDGRLVAVGACNWTANSGIVHVMSNMGILLNTSNYNNTVIADGFIYFGRGSHKFVRDALSNFNLDDYDNWIPLSGSGAVTVSGYYSGDGWGNIPGKSRSGFIERFSLSEQEYRGVTNDVNHLVVVTINTSPFTYTVKPSDIGVKHVFNGLDCCDVTIYLPNAPTSPTDIWRFHFECKCEPKFRTVGGFAIDGTVVAQPLIYSYTGNTYVDFIPSVSGCWQSTNKSTDIERVFRLDSITTGVWANDRGITDTLINVVAPSLGDSVYSTLYAAYFYYDGISNDVTAGWSCWEQQNPANSPYIAMSNGESRIIVSDSDMSKRCIIILPGKSGVPGSIEYNLMQYTTPYTELCIDTSSNNNEGVVILTASWINTDLAIQADDRNIRRKYPSIPVAYVDSSVHGGAIALGQNASVVFEPYLEYNFELPGSRTNLSWSPTSGYGTLFKRANPGQSDGWGSNAEVNQYGMVCRYTLSEREYLASASKMFVDVFTDTTDYSATSPFDVYAAWVSATDIGTNASKTHLVLNPSAIGTGGNLASTAHFLLPAISAMSKGLKITLEFTNNNGKDCVVIAQSGDGFTTGSAPMSYSGIDPTLNWVPLFNRPGCSCTLTRPENGQTAWIVEYHNFAGLEYKGWGNSPDWSTGKPERYTLSALEYTNLNYPKDFRVVRDSNFVLNNGPTIIESAEGFINRFQPMDSDLVVETNVSNLSNGLSFWVYNYSATYDVILKNSTDNYLIGGLLEYRIHPGHLVEFVQRFNVVTNAPELIVLRSTQYQIPTPSITDVGKAVTVNSSGKYELSTVSGSGSRNIDGGNPFSVYLPSQIVSGGTP